MRDGGVRQAPPDTPEQGLRSCSSAPCPARSEPFSGFPRTSAALLILGGALGYFIGHPNPLIHIPLFALLTPFSLYILAWNSSSGKTALLHGWLPGLMGQACALYWLVFPILDVGKLPLPLAVPCVLSLAAYLALYPALFCLTLRGLIGLFSLPRKDPPLTLPAGLIPPILGGLAWGGLEATGGILFTGFPWLPLSTAFVPWPNWVQAASLIGGCALSGLLAVVSCLCAAALLGASRERLMMVLLCFWLCASLPLYGAARLAPNEQQAQKKTSSHAIVMVQGNVDQSQKWSPAFQLATVEKYMKLTKKALEEAKSDGVDPVMALWPETAMPFFYQADGVLGGTLRRFARTNAVNLAFGTLGFQRHTSGVTSYFNRLQFISSQGRDLAFYDKEHLVPFGEYIPLSLRFEFLRNILQGSDFSSGGQEEALVVPLPEKISGLQQVPPGSLAFGILICYEVIFPELAWARVANGAEILLTVSNDAWFGLTSAPVQHLHLAAMRCVEQFRPMLRATNTGYSGIIDPYGRITEKSGLFADETLLARISPATGHTLYHRLAPVPEIVLMLLAALVFVGPWLVSRHNMTGLPSALLPLFYTTW